MNIKNNSRVSYNVMQCRNRTFSTVTTNTVRTRLRDIGAYQNKNNNNNGISIVKLNYRHTRPSLCVIRIVGGSVSVIKPK